jgi:hypothetical protein
MKKFFSILFVLLLTVSILPADNSNTVTVNRIYTNPEYAVNTNGFPVLTGVEVKITFTADSTNSQATQTIKIPEFIGVNAENYPVTFRLKAVGTYGVPNRFISLQGLFASDTVSIDTVSQHAVNQTESDTLGILTFNKIKFSEAGFKVFIRNITADIHSGTLTLLFPVPTEAVIRKK